MTIAGVQVVPFETCVDRISFGQLMTDYRVVQTATKVMTDEGVEGYYFGGQFHGDQDGLLPGDRAEIWRQLWAAKLPENVCSVIDLTLWDLAGRVTGLPVYKLLGGARERVKAYASSFNNLGSPDDYAAHAADCTRRGYRAYKIHPYHYWNPATGQFALPRPSYLEFDMEVCRTVRAAVGDMVLMFDPWGTYHTYDDAQRVGRELERLGFYW